MPARRRAIPSGWSSIRRRSVPGRTSQKRNEPAGRDRASRPAAWWPSPRTPPSRWPPSRSPVRCTRRQLAPDGHGPANDRCARHPPSTPGPIRPAGGSPTCADGTLRITDLESGTDAELIGPGGAPHISYGLAEFVAAEEMGRQRGFWWAPDGSSLLVARVDNSGVNRWHIGDPANPDRQPAEIRYPAAGTQNAAVELLIVNTDGGTVRSAGTPASSATSRPLSWDSGAPLIVVQSRDQRRMRLLAVDPQTGATSVVRDEHDPCWLDVVPGVPARTGGRQDRLDRATPTTRGACSSRARQDLADGKRRAGHAAGPADQERAVGRRRHRAAVRLRRRVHAGGRLGLRPGRPAADLRACAASRARSRGGGTTVLASRSMAGVRGERHGAPRSAGHRRGRHGSGRHRARSPRARPCRSCGSSCCAPGRASSTPRCCCRTWYEPGSAKLPVLMDPYGGPHGQRVRGLRRRAPDLAVVREPGLRGRRRRRPRHAWARAELGPGRRRRPGRPASSMTRSTR